MEIELVLEPADLDVDETDATGLTEAAYDRLMDTLMELGYSFVSGPSVVG